MAINVGGNPKVKEVGVDPRKVTIMSGRNETDEVTYQIERRDGQQHTQGHLSRPHHKTITNQIRRKFEKCLTFSAEPSMGECVMRWAFFESFRR